jgi:hypothetical protein
MRPFFRLPPLPPPRHQAVQRIGQRHIVTAARGRLEMGRKLVVPQRLHESRQRPRVVLHTPPKAGSQRTQAHQHQRRAGQQGRRLQGPDEGQQERAGQGQVPGEHPSQALRVAPYGVHHKPWRCMRRYSEARVSPS